MNLGRRICIVSSGCLSSGPRVVKEADALAEAGCVVHLVVCHTMEWMESWDAEVARGRGWTYTAVRWLEPNRRRSVSGLAANSAARFARGVGRAVGPVVGVDELASSGVVPVLLREAFRHPAALYIAHNLAALPVARIAAARHGALFAFDAEDDHFAELSEQKQRSAEGRRVNALLARHLPFASYVSTASRPMAEALRTRYGLRAPVVVHNVFPWSERDSLDGRRLERKGDGLSLYWYSQSLGLDRGLQDVLAAMGQLRGKVELHLRGNGDEEVLGTLRALATEAGVQDYVRFHSQIPPGQLLSRTAEHDVGLALEPPITANRRRTVSNKLFYYMLAGLAIAATDTEGQRGVMAQAPGAGFIYASGDADGLAAGLQQMLDEPERLKRAKVAALEAARNSFCWERERDSLLEAVGGALEARHRPGFSELAED
jgi:glycosyltransferase involved in cell wall biosynthesis